MALDRQENWQGQQRVDVPHLRAVESGVAHDFDVAMGRVIGGEQPLVVSGFKVNMTGAVGAPASTLQLLTAGSIAIHFNASESGSLFSVPSDRAAETLSSSNSRVSGSFAAGVANYIGIDFARAADDSTADLVQFSDATTGAETPKTIPLARTVDYRIVISTNDFSSLAQIAPLAIVVTDANNNVVSVADARDLMYRLASGGTTPNPQNAYGWPQGRAENLTGDVFSGGDKSIGSQKEWDDALASVIWDAKGGAYWYTPSSDRYNRLTRGPLVFSNGEQFEWTGTNLHWKNLRFIFGNGLSSVYYNDIVDQTGDSAGLTDLAEGDCLYVDIDFTQNRMGGSAVSAVKVALTNLGAPVVPGSRQVLAWRTNSVIYTKDGQFAVGTTFKLATATGAGAVELNINPDPAWPTSTTPVVPIVATSVSGAGRIIGGGLTRGISAAANVGAGQLRIGDNATYDTALSLGNTSAEIFISTLRISAGANEPASSGNASFQWVSIQNRAAGDLLASWYNNNGGFLAASLLANGNFIASGQVSGTGQAGGGTGGLFTGGGTGGTGLRAQGGAASGIGLDAYGGAPSGVTVGGIALRATGADAVTPGSTPGKAGVFLGGSDPNGAVDGQVAIDATGGSSNGSDGGTAINATGGGGNAGGSAINATGANAGAGIGGHGVRGKGGVGAGAANGASFYADTTNGPAISTNGRGSAPSNPTDGDLYYDTALKIWRHWFSDVVSVVSTVNATVTTGDWSGAIHKPRGFAAAGNGDPVVTGGGTIVKSLTIPTVAGNFTVGELITQAVTAAKAYVVSIVSNGGASYTLEVVCITGTDTSGNNFDAIHAVTGGSSAASGIPNAADWTNQQFKYYMDSDRVIHVEGVVGNVDTSASLGMTVTLPPGYRPLNNDGVTVPIYTIGSTTPTLLRIKRSGVIQIPSGAVGWNLNFSFKTSS